MATWTLLWGKVRLQGAASVEKVRYLILSTGLWASEVMWMRNQVWAMTT